MRILLTAASLLVACSNNESTLTPIDTDVDRPFRVVLPLEADATYVGGPGTGFREDGIGDLDGDGADEVAVAEIYATVDGRVGAGRVQILLGDPNGQYGPSPGVAWYGTEEGELLGSDALQAGDTNGDGDPELLMGGLGFWLASEPQRGGAVGAGALNFPGDVAANLGDLDGDGIDDLAVHRGVIGEPAMVAVWLGPPTARSADILVPGRVDDGFGVALASGDVDGDGLEELAVGAPFAREEAGAVFLYGIDDLRHGRPEAVLSGMPSQRIGLGLAIPGDIDGDGYADLLAGGMAHDGAGGCGEITQPVAGAFFPGPVGSGTTADARAVFTWNGPGCARLGEPLDDLDGDGRAEIALLTDRSAWIFLDAPGGVVPLGEASVHVEGPVGCCTLGDADVNGDGHNDLLVGSQSLENPFVQPGEVYFLLGPLQR